jgi:hypothetical protein
VTTTLFSIAASVFLFCPLSFLNHGPSSPTLCLLIVFGSSSHI